MGVMRAGPERAGLARVVSVGRNAAWVAFEDSEEIVFASLRKHQERLALVPGDLVRAQCGDGQVIVDSREPRTFALVRHTRSGRTKTMAANIDGIAIVTALADPPFHAAMVDELLAYAAVHEIDATLMLTKADLAEPALATSIVDLYRTLGYTVLSINPRIRAGLDDVERALGGRKTLLIGQSGVGKSSLFRAFGGPGDVGEVSKIGRGRQTTTTGRLHRFAAGFMIDSPGVSDFELQGVQPQTIANGFVEFVPLLGKCRFTDCTHRTEPGCAIREAVDAGSIAGSRYESYRAIVARGVT